MKNFHITIFRSWVLAGMFVMCLLALVGTASALNIDPANKYAWGENVGWINFGSVEGDVDVSATGMDGYAWGENIGWVSLSCTNTSSCGTVDYGVTISGSTVAGFAWGENVGWVSFNCSNTSSCGTVDYSVSLNTATGDFSGYAWGENIGWIVFNCATTSSCGTVDYKLRTGFSSAPPPGGGSGSYIPSSPTPTPSVVVPVSPSVSASPSPRPSFRPSVPPPTPPAGEPPMIPTPTASPPGAVPTAPPTPPVDGGPEIPLVVRFIDRLSGLFDSIFAFLGFGDRTICVGALGMAACTVTAISLIVVAAALLGALLRGELIAVGFALLQFFGVRRKAKVWGVVYDSRTKRPIPLAKLELLDASNRVLETRYADRDGRYGFLMSPASLHEEELHVQVKASKSGFIFPSASMTTGTDYVVYDNLYHGGMIVMKGNTLLNYNIPMDPTAHGHLSWGGFGQGLVGTVGSKLLSLGFYIGLVVVPLNWWFMPTTMNLVILVAFFLFNGIRMLALYRPYGVTIDVLTGKRLPFTLVTLNDLQGNRQGFAVSDERGRFILSGEQNKDYEIIAYTPANIIPQRSIRLSVRGIKRMSTRAWITNSLRI